MFVVQSKRTGKKTTNRHKCEELTIAGRNARLESAQLHSELYRWHPLQKTIVSEAKKFQTLDGSGHSPEKTVSAVT